MRLLPFKNALIGTINAVALRERGLTSDCDEAAKTAWRIVANIAKLSSPLRQ